MEVKADKMIDMLRDYRDMLETLIVNGQCDMLGYDQEAVVQEIKELEELLKG